MNIFAESAALLNSLDGAWLTAPAGLIADALIKVTLVFGLAALATLALGKASAAARHLVWALALGCALILALGASRASAQQQWATIKGQVVFPARRMVATFVSACW